MTERITTDWSLLPGPYGAIAVDPPWPYDGKGPVGIGGRRSKDIAKKYISITTSPSSVERYGSMSIPELLALPVGERAAENSHLYLWVTNSFLDEGFDLIKAWGFKYKTTITWGKVKNDLSRTPSMKTGFYFRGATEHILFAIRGKLRLQSEEPYATLRLSERLEHSVKPPWFYEMVEDCSPGPWLEIFSRRLRRGWDCFGDQQDKDEEAAASDTEGVMSFDFGDP